MTRIKGLDSSHWNGKPDWEKAASLGIEWAYVKAGEMNPNTGQPYDVDSVYSRNIQKCREAGLMVGAYYFFHPKVGASAQARHFEKLMEAYGEPDFLVVDLETADSMNPQDVASVLKVFLDRLEDDLGKRPLIYTGNYFWGGSVGAPSWGKNYYFIIAQYPTTEPVRDMDKFYYKMSPVNSAIADRVVAWQFSDNTRLPGLPRLDGNFWLAGSELLHELAGKEAPDVIETEEIIEPEHGLSKAEMVRGERQEQALEIWNKSHTEMNSIWWKLRNLGR